MEENPIWTDFRTRDGDIATLNNTLRQRTNHYINTGYTTGAHIESYTGLEEGEILNYLRGEELFLGDLNSLTEYLFKLIEGTL